MRKDFFVGADRRRELERGDSLLGRRRQIDRCVTRQLYKLSESRDTIHNLKLMYLCTKSIASLYVNIIGAPENCEIEFK